MKFLMIANSFGVNLQAYASSIGKANNFNLDIYVLYIGGCSLDTHWNNIENNSKNYELFHNGETTGKMISILEALEFSNWDVISLQQASHCSGIKETYYPYFGNVYNYVKKICPNSKIAFHQTWAYSNVNTYKYDQVPSFYNLFKFADAISMKQGIDSCLKAITQDYQIDYIINSGDVVALASEKFADCYDSQGFHMNGIGSYLIGLNLIKIFSGKKIENAFVPDGLGKKTCQRAIEFINNNF